MGSNLDALCLLSEVKLKVCLASYLLVYYCLHFPLFGAY